MVTDPDWHAFAHMALEEDRAAHDATTNLLAPQASRSAVGRFFAGEALVVAGLPLAQSVFESLGDIKFIACVAEGAWVRESDVVASVEGTFGVLLSAERVALNYIQRLCGIATLTRRVVDAVQSHNVDIVDTRKTTPGLRSLEKYAVRIGGGVNHRFSLEDAVLWKDNHWALLRDAGVSLKDALSRNKTGVPVQVEVEHVDQLAEVTNAGVTSVLIDNQSPETIAEWARILGPDVTIEASGGITPDKAPAYAQAGVHRISMGWITHSVKAVEMNFEIVRA